MQHFELGGAQLAALAALTIYYRAREKRRQREVIQHIDTLAASVDSAAGGSMMSCPLPMLVVNLDSEEIIWSNAQFRGMSGLSDSFLSSHLGDVVPNFDLKWLVRGKSENPSDISLGESTYHVYGSLIRPFQGRGDRSDTTSLLAVLYWVDTTELHKARKVITDSHPAFGIILLDNYEEIVRGMAESEKSSLHAGVDERVTAWLQDTGAYFRRYDRDRYLFVVDNATLKQLTEDKFSVLAAIRELTTADNQPITISIGIGIHVKQFNEASGFAQLAIEMAQGRGGDQVVIKDAKNFEYFGGHTREMEKRTKVKSRVIANALRELMLEADQVYIMGHTESDIDSVGSAGGVALMAATLDKPAYIVINENKTAATVLIERMKEEHPNMFITPLDAVMRATSQTLLVVVDTSRIDFVESPDLLDTIKNIAVIDHHRRSANYIERTAIVLHEPYASSTSELVTELMQYMLEPKQVTRLVAEGLLGGISLDTKFFTMHTGIRTFEAATYLRAAGADMTSVKRMFQTNLDETKLRYEILNKAEIIRDNLAIAAQDALVPLALAAQAADELLDLRTIAASFVLSPYENGVNINARSMDVINVQVICEKLGGGGHMNIAGAQLTDMDVLTAKNMLLEAIEKYFEEMG